MSDDMPTTTAKTTVINKGSSLVMACVATMAIYAALHIHHDLLYLDCLRDGFPKPVCMEFAEKNPADLDGHGLAWVVMDACGLHDGGEP